jgi:hypothetical protein
MGAFLCVPLFGITCNYGYFLLYLCIIQCSRTHYNIVSQKALLVTSV